MNFAKVSNMMFIYLFGQFVFLEARRCEGYVYNFVICMMVVQFKLYNYMYVTQVPKSLYLYALVLEDKRRHVALDINGIPCWIIVLVSIFFFMKQNQTYKVLNPRKQVKYNMMYSIKIIEKYYLILKIICVLFNSFWLTQKKQVVLNAAVLDIATRIY